MTKPTVLARQETEWFLKQDDCCIKQPINYAGLNAE